MWTLRRTRPSATSRGSHLNTAMRSASGLRSIGRHVCFGTGMGDAREDRPATGFTNGEREWLRIPLESWRELRTFWLRLLRDPGPAADEEGERRAMEALARCDAEIARLEALLTERKAVE